MFGDWVSGIVYRGEDGAITAREVLPEDELCVDLAATEVGEDSVGTPA
jgi:hypothetical protein